MKKEPEEIADFKWTKEGFIKDVFALPNIKQELESNPVKIGRKSINEHMEAIKAKIKELESQQP